MAGLLDPRANLAAQIRAQYQTGQGGSGSWDDAGVDRALELADMLLAAGVTDLGEMSFVDTPWEEQVGGGWNSYGVTPTWEDPSINSGVRRKLKIGDKELGYLGNAGEAGSGADFLKGESLVGQNDSTTRENLLGWSAAGDGNTSYRVITDPNTGKLVIAPGWNSSSEADNWRKTAIAGGLMMAGGYGLSALGPGAAAGAETGMTGFLSPELVGGSFGAGSAQTGLGAAAGGIGTMGTIAPGSAPVGSLSTMGTVTAPTIAEAAYLPTMAELAGGTGLLGTIAQGSGPVSALDTMGTVAEPAVAPAASIPSLSVDSAGTSILDGLLSDPVKLAAVVAGGVAGAEPSGGGSTAKTMNLDPRIDPLVFGNDGLLKSATDWWNKYKATGQNQTMVDAQNSMRGLLTSPEFLQGINNQFTASAGLLNPVQKNPFTWPPR